MEHEIHIVVIPEKEVHPYADALSIVRINGEQLVINHEWETGDKAVLIPADFFVPNTKPFEFLGGKAKHRRIKPRSIRGVWSEGLMLPVTEFPELDGLPVGTNVMQILGIERYDFENVFHNPKISTIQDVLTGEPPGITTKKYQLLNYKKDGAVLVPGEHVRVTEKIHGSNACYGLVNGKVYIGTRNMWVDWEKSPSPQAKFYRSPAAEELKEWLEANPNKLIYGEVFGWVASLRYGAEPNQVFFKAFDVWDEHRGWCEPPGYLSVPVLYQGPFNEDVVKGFVDGKSMIQGADHIREGIVIEPLPSRHDEYLGRLKFKWVSNDYLAGGF